MSGDTVVLDFENAEVRSSDYDSLKPSGWLTGEIINFYWTFLERREFHSTRAVLFLGTYTAYRISTANCSRDTDMISTQLAQELGGHRRLILVPLNSRSHWSLLVYCRPTRTFYHYDSIASHNRAFAERAAGRFLRVLEPCAKDGFYFKSMQTPQQNNDHDCGVYVLAIAEELARRYVNHVERPRARRRDHVQQHHEGEKNPGQHASRTRDQHEEARARAVYDKLNAARDFAPAEQSPASRTLSHAAAAAAAAPLLHAHQSRRPSSDHPPHATLPNRALASHLLMPRFASPAFAPFHSPFERFTLHAADNTYARHRPPEPLLKGGGQLTASDHVHQGSLGRASREERLRMEVDMMEKAGLPRDFWLVTVEDIEYPQGMRKRIRKLVVELRRQQGL